MINRKMDTVFQVPTIDIRERIPFEVINEIARQIADRFKPQKIILFGSYAYGSPRPESDVDVLVVMKTSMREIQQGQQIRQFLNPLFGLDLLVYTPDNLARRIEWGDAFLREIVARGKVLYESVDA
jgi:predicted nucleotidyltransferase